MWYAGIDWADSHHDTLVIDEKGRQVGSLRIAHTPAGMNQLNTFLEQIIGQASKEEMACIIETTHGLLMASLLEAGWPVYPVLVGSYIPTWCFHIFPLVESRGTHPLLTFVFLACVIYSKGGWMLPCSSFRIR
jgi:hypothetical protein